MPVPNTNKTILALLGMAVQGFAKGSMMAQMADDKGLQAKKEAEEKRKAEMEDKAFEFLTQGYMDQTLPYGQRKKFGTALSQFYGNLGYEKPPGDFDFKEPYQMTAEENARMQMRDPTTFRMLGKEMLSGDQADPNADLERRKLELDIEEYDYKFRRYDAQIAAYNRSKTADRNDKNIVIALKHKLDARFKELAAYKHKYRGLQAANQDQWQPILDDIQNIMAQLDDYIANDDGGVREPIQGF